MVRTCLSMQNIQVRSLVQEDPMEKEMTIHSSILAWEMPWTEEPGGLQSMGSERVGQDLATTQQQNIDIDGLPIFIILPNNLIIGLI